MFSLNNTWRCGVFVPEPGVMFEEPLATYFVMQNYGVTSCPATPEETDKEGAFATKCAEMVIMMMMRAVSACVPVS